MSYVLRMFICNGLYYSHISTSWHFKELLSVCIFFLGSFIKTAEINWRFAVVFAADRMRVGVFRVRLTPKCQSLDLLNLKPFGGHQRVSAFVNRQYENANNFHLQESLRRLVTVYKVWTPSCKDWYPASTGKLELIFDHSKTACSCF